MTYTITDMCLRDGGCSTVCPVECIVPGKPVEEWPWYYIDPETCIDCGACVPECPYLAIFPLDEVPTKYKAKGTERLAAKAGTPGFTETFDGTDHFGKKVHMPAIRTMKAGEVIDFTPANEINADYFTKGPGYSAVK
jgi:ferredoxin